MGDNLLLTVPWRTYNRKVLLSGEIPFWNPYIFCGYPHFAALQSNSLYPPVVLFDLWDPLEGLGWVMALHIALAGSLMFLFLRCLGLGRDASTFGAVAFEFNGFFLVRMGAPSYVFSGIWTPLLLLGVHEVAAKRKGRSAWKIVLAVMMSFLGGHPQILAFMLTIGGAYGIFVALNTRRLTGRPLFESLIRPAAIALVAVILGFGLVGFQLVPFVELVGETAREPASYDSFRKCSLPPIALLQAGIPDFFGHPVDNNYWLSKITSMVDPAPTAQRLWGINYCGGNLFTGAIPLVFALVAFFGLRSRVALVFGGLLTASTLVVLGSPALRVLYLAAPIFRFSRPDRIIFVGMVSVSVLAAIGYQSLKEKNWTDPSGPGSRKVTLIYVVLISLAVIWPTFINPGFSGGYGSLYAAAYEHLGPNVASVGFQAIVFLCTALSAVAVTQSFSEDRKKRAIGLAITLALTLAPLFHFGWKFNPSQPRPLFAQSEALDRLAALVGTMGRVARIDGANVLPPNTGSLFAFFDVNGSSAIALRSYVSLIDAMDPRAVNKQKYFKSFEKNSVVDERLLDLLGVQAILSDREWPLVEADFSRPGFRVYERASALERFFFVDEVESYSDDSAATTRLTDGSFDPAESALVREDGPGSELARDTTSRDSAPGRVHLVSYGPHEIVLDIDTARRRLLVSSEVFYPGWVSYIDDEITSTILVNTAFRGVVVPPGRHSVVFRYQPRSFVIGSILSALSLVCLLVFLFVLGRPSHETS